jgi:hypothetical protein
MARYIGSTCKICRKLNFSVCGSDRCTLLRAIIYLAHKNKTEFVLPINMYLSLSLYPQVLGMFLSSPSCQMVP